MCEEQLSKQRHYDFGLRNILSVLRTGGVNLRVELLKDSQQDRSNLEEMLMMRTLRFENMHTHNARGAAQDGGGTCKPAPVHSTLWSFCSVFFLFFFLLFIRDMNLSKLVADDVDLFISLLHDLFPNQRDPEKRRYDAEEEAMRTVIEDKRLVHHDTWVTKIVQLYETSLVRHGLMMVGPAGSGQLPQFPSAHCDSARLGCAHSIWPSCAEFWLTLSHCVCLFFVLVQFQVNPSRRKC